MENIFKFAAKAKLTFASKRGNLSVEDLFDLKLEQLDEIYRALKKEANSNEDSLLEQKTATDETLEVKIAIVKEIFNDKLAEKAAAANKAEKAAERQKIMAVLAAKENEALMSKSAEELRKMLEGEE